MIKAVIFLGPPASGKGTQAMIIAHNLGAIYFRTSKIIKDRFDNFPNDPEVIKAKILHDSGELVPASILVKWTVQEIEKLFQAGETVVFDGVFRSMQETDATFPTFEKYLKPYEIKAFFLKVSENTAIKRSSTRRICSVCGYPAPYNSQTIDLKLCLRPKCGGELIARIDEKKIHKRLEIYNKETLPVLDFFKKKGILEEIDGEPSIEEITENILNKIKNTF